MNDAFRLACIGLLFFSIFVLFQRWQEWPQNATDGSLQTSSAPLQQTDVPSNSTGADNALPTPTQSLTNNDNESLPEVVVKAQTGNIIRVQTDWLEADISENGGALVSLHLKKHLNDNGGFYPLLEDGTRRQIAQNGLIGVENAPNHYSTYTVIGGDNFTLADGAEKLTVSLVAQSGNLQLIKKYIFSRSDYLISVALEAHNTGAETVSPYGYFQIAHNGQLNTKQSSLLPTFFGAAIYTDATKFDKISFEDIGSDTFPKKSTDGWIGIIQHYFAAVWLPDAGEREYFMSANTDNGVRRVGVIAPFGALAAGESKTVGARLFAGAQEQDILNALDENSSAPGLHLVVDYGWLTFIAVLLFKLLTLIENFVGNWGVAIILLTFFIKLMFYPLSSVSYRSIARMKELSPRIKNLQERYKDDKQQQQQAMMALYREKKINPFGGCLPILMQIPVFIALYWVILGSVELRQAPFILWIDDLSKADPYFIFPLLMGGSMFLQMRMSPTPPDPTQAMIIKVMPIFFTIFSLFFPSGLVLYWLVNNLLSIAQQWHITRSTTGGAGNK
ncbi:membrane protein insertase YidC [Candidatus Persebacteraceae bacterium Df01]|jgi:YidC/Oxa1 family membrane protein insertase|uniref:Membrane protein insertase YidC n=1 Tax=Candidatus Doriopsillibacter californiensis TaxID=2970740 RepID=A0ABT7QNG2_9GAMM|nr:membrane protein insertase YidC [Candidatus Persebacteraceae bacterium Df01]